MLGYPDSNQERQDQNLQCYHYTIAQTMYCYFSDSVCKGTHFFSTDKTFCLFFTFNFQILIYLTIFAPLNKYSYKTHKMSENTELLIDKIVKGMQEKKGRNIVVADLTSIGDTICEAFVICTAGSPAQAQAIADSVAETARKEAHAKPIATTGLRNALWVAMDYADVMVHIFLPEERDYYDLEHLWADAQLTQVPDLD